MPPRNTATRDKHRRTIARGEPPCSICGLPIDYTLVWPDPGCFVVDHVISLDAGGTDELANKAAAHRLCNARKGTRTHADIIKRSSTLARPWGGNP